MDIEILGVVTGVLAVVCLLEIVLLILLGLFSYSLYKAAKQKTLTVFQLVDMIMSVFRCGTGSKLERITSSCLQGIKIWVE